MIGEQKGHGPENKSFSDKAASSSPSAALSVSEIIKIPANHYLKQMTVNDGDIVAEFLPKKKVALCMIAINQLYWDYARQCIEDCRKNFLPHHKVDFFVWSDMPADYLPNVSLTETEPVSWPAPTLMRYHLFLQKEEELSKYDYVFYLDADMRVVDKISDEILGQGLTAAPHPGYEVKPLYIPPLEPNKNSTAYIPRLGRMKVGPDGKERFFPFYAAGGFQGGVAREFLSAMKCMKDRIDKDFQNNYVAIWNDESHWNKYLFDYQNEEDFGAAPKERHITFLDVSYIYPDSLIKELYEPILWGKSYTPKIITLTKPFTTSKQAGSELKQLLGGQAASQEIFQCPTCKDHLEHPGHRIQKVVKCQGSGKPHLLDMVKI